MSHHTDEEFGKTHASLYLLRIFVMFCIIFTKPKEDQTGCCAVHYDCPTMYLSVRTRILKTFHVVSVKLLIRYELRFKTAI
jgi:hypothetical protein